jgi:hypothetical protein
MRYAPAIEDASLQRRGAKSSSTVEPWTDELLLTFIRANSCEHRAKSKDSPKSNEIMASRVNRTVETVSVLNYLVHRATQIATRRSGPGITFAPSNLHC